MGYRTVIIDSPAKISTSNNYLIVRREEVTKIHFSEIHYLMVANTSVNITGVALCELAKNKIKVVFCDEKYNPYGEVTSYYGCHNSSKKLALQLHWRQAIVSEVNTIILHKKITNQAKLLDKLGFKDRANMIYDFADEMQIDDESNREGHAAKVYFNTLFGLDFTRDYQSDINSALNYGYSILLSCINREVVCNGCLTQLGLNHKNEYNQFNFSCDIIEPFRVIVDEYVYEHRDRVFDKDYKYELINLLNKKVFVKGHEAYLHNAISIIVKSIIDSLNNENSNLLCLYDFK